MKNKFTVYSLLSSIVLGLLLLTFSIAFIGEFITFIRILSNSQMYDGALLATDIISSILSMACCGFIIFLGALEISKLLKGENNNSILVFKSLGLYLTVSSISYLMLSIIGFADAGLIVMSIFLLLVGLLSLLLGFFKINLNDKAKVITSFVALGLDFVFVIVLLATTFSTGLLLAVGIFLIFVLITSIAISVLELLNKNALNYELNITLNSTKTSEETNTEAEEIKVEDDKEEILEETEETTATESNLEEDIKE